METRNYYEIFSSRHAIQEKNRPNPSPIQNRKKFNRMALVVNVIALKHTNAKEIVK